MQLPMTLFFEHPKDPLYVALEQQALDLMLGFSQREPNSHEAGGVLIGERKNRGLTIKLATPPQSADRSSRTRFYRSEQGHQQLVNEAWLASGGRSDYVGEWHTHPEEQPNPSFVDKVGWGYRVMVVRKPLAVLIIGTSGIFVGYQNRSLTQLIAVPTF
jgi:integrative and conjugative element protein (TIGR02256 family)